MAKGKDITVDDFSPYRIAEFWSRIHIAPATGCMEYQGGERNSHGYRCIEMRGRTSRSHRRVMAHRAAYAMTYGYLDGDVVLRHSCDNPICINVDHLLPGTQVENIADMMSRGRHWSQRKRSEAHAH